MTLSVQRSCLECMSLAYPQARQTEIARDQLDQEPRMEFEAGVLRDLGISETPWIRRAAPLRIHREYRAIGCALLETVPSRNASPRSKSILAGWRPLWIFRSQLIRA